MKKETYLVIGSDSMDDLRRIKFAGNAEGVDLLVLSDICAPDSKYENLDVYKKALNVLLDDDLSGVVFVKCCYAMGSRELAFWNYLERLAKRMGLKVLQEWELRKPEKIDFDSLKNPNQELHEKMLGITMAFKDAVQNVMDSEEEKDAELKARINSVFGSKPGNEGIEYHKYSDVYHVEETFPGPVPITVDINISIGGRRDSRGDQNGKHGSGCNDSAGGSGEPRSGWDASGCRCSSEPDGQFKISK